LIEKKFEKMENEGRSNVIRSQIEVVNYAEHNNNIEQITYERNNFWYKEAVFYEVYIRAFCDSNNDGHGDLQGLTSRLDYLSALGVNCIWLLPMYPSPLKDDGYDVADYRNIHSHYGNLNDFKVLVKAVHERNMRVIADLIPNHTSDQHEWFKQSRSDRNSPFRDYYVWSDTPTKYKEARIIFVDTETSNWTWDEVAGQYYWHRFYSSQPDLNFENPKVQEEMLNIMRFWLDLGIDGFRVDAVPYLFESEGTSCENLPATHAYLKVIRNMIDKEYPGRVLLAEACQLPHEVREYFGENGEEFHMGFHFPVMPRIYMSIKAEQVISLKQILAATPDIPDQSQWVTFLRNHDELTLEMVTPEERKWMWEQYAPNMRMRINMGIRRRLAPLMDNDRRKIELAHSILLTLPGSPILYYGDEICMGDNIWLDDRNGVRTPMQWDCSRPHAGFSNARRIYAPVVDSSEFGPDKVNVKDAQNDPSSFYHILKHMLHTRRKHPSFGWGKLLWVDNNEPAVGSWIRYHGEERLLIVSNTSHQIKEVAIYLPQPFQPPGKVAKSILTREKFELNNGIVQFQLEPYEFLWIDLDPLIS